MRLKGFNNIGYYTLCDQLERNLISYFNWGFLQAGGFFNVDEQLTLINEPTLPGKKVYVPSSKSIVWESGLESYSVQVPEVRVNGVVVTNYTLDYDRGYVIFNSTPAATPTMKYAFRSFNFVSDDKPWFEKIVGDLYRVSDGAENTVNSVLSDAGVQLPTVVVQCDPYRRFEGYQLGGGQKVQQDVLFTIFASNTWGRKKLIDAITFQKERAVPMYDLNAVASTVGFEFNDDGTLNPDRVGYEQLISRPGPYSWDKNMLFKGDPITKDFVFSPPIYTAQIKFPMEVIMGNI